MSSLPTRLAVASRLAVAALSAGLVVASPSAAFAGRGGSDRQRARTAQQNWSDEGHRRGQDARQGNKGTNGTPGDRSAARPDKQDRVPERFRARCFEAIDRRLSALDRVAGRLAGIDQVTEAHQAALAAIMAKTTARLNDLRDEIAADTDADALRAHCRSIFVDHRVFALVLPRTGLVVAADMTVAAADRLEEVADALAAAIAEAEADGQDVTEAEADLASMVDRITSARKTAAGVPGSILDLDPADWNADHNVLLRVRQALGSARGDLREASKLAKQIRHDLNKS